MMLRRVKYKATLVGDTREYAIGYKIVSISIGADNCYYVLTVNNVPERVDGMFPQTQTTTLQNYRIIKVQWDNVYVIDIGNQKWNYHFVQPIVENKILLACARSEYYNESKYDLNGRIFDLKGSLIREFLLGDGIQNLQVTSSNIIWTSYFDEGVFGNYGWNEPIGSCGLRAWDQYGKSVYEYNNYGDKFISGCYALNAKSDDEIWFYYYTDFLLGRFKNDRVDYFEPELSGSDGFLVYDKYVLFRGEYSNHNEYQLFEFTRNEKLQEKKTIVFTNETDDVINADDIDCRGSSLLMRVGTKLYIVDLKDIIELKKQVYYFRHVR